MKDERGGVLIEVLVSSILLVIAAVGIFNAFDAATRSTAEQRHRAQAHGLAQSDLARMRTMKISALRNLHETRAVVVDGTTYSVESRGSFQGDKTSTASCKEGTVSADYIQITSIVSWPGLNAGRDPVTAQSLVSPPNGTLSAKNGALVVFVEGGGGAGVPNVGLDGEGVSSFSGATGNSGCAVFGDLPAGQYTLSASGPPGMSVFVDKDGEAPEPKLASVVAEGTNTVAFQADEGGEIVANFETWVDGAPVPSSADALVVFHTGMTKGRTFGTPGTPEAPMVVEPLFPFDTEYAVYAGTCKGNNPELAGEEAPEDALADALVSPGGSTAVTIKLAPLNLSVWDGTGPDPAERGEPVAGAEVQIEDTACPEESFVRSFETNAEGELDDPGLPFSRRADGEEVGGYGICVAHGGKHIELGAPLNLPEVPSELAKGSTVSFYLGHEDAEDGPCP